MPEIDLKDLIDLFALLIGYVAFYFLGKLRSDWKNADIIEPLAKSCRESTDEILKLRIENMHLKGVFEPNCTGKDNVAVSLKEAQSFNKCCQCEKERHWKIILNETKTETQGKYYCADHFPKVS